MQGADIWRNEIKGLPLLVGRHANASCPLGNQVLLFFVEMLLYVYRQAWKQRIL